MSTVTTRLCQYGHANCYQHMGQTVAAITSITPSQKRLQAANEARLARLDAKREQFIQRIEEMLADGVEPEVITSRVGYSSVRGLQSRLYGLGRVDLARQFQTRQPGRAPDHQPRCAIKDCRGIAVWIEDPGLDPDDEPIAEWGYLCHVCQRFEDLCEDLTFLLDPKRGNESNVHNICGRVGYEPSLEGLEALRQKLKRHDRLDLRDALSIESVNGQRGWHVQGTIHSDINNHWLRLVSAEAVRAHEREDADPGRRLLAGLSA